MAITILTNKRKENIREKEKKILDYFNVISYARHEKYTPTASHSALLRLGQLLNLKKKKTENYHLGQGISILSLGTKLEPLNFF